MVVAFLAAVGCARSTQVPLDGGDDGGPAVCGNGQIEEGEVCDDGNTVDGDDCRSDCGQDLTLCGNGVEDPGETCDDGNTTGGDGCSDTCQHAICDATVCPNGCCDLDGECRSGLQDSVCGNEGVVCEDCVFLELICHEQVCQDLGACTPEETLDCGHCGTRTCRESGEWGACADEGACAPGQVEETGSCGNCGTLQRICQEDCTWGSLDCANEGDCEPNAVETGGTCDQCGIEERTCTAQCTWGDYVCIEGAGEETFYQDSDTDGYGNPNSTIQACSVPTGYVTNSDDCDDSNINIHPGASDACANCVDEDCSGLDTPCDATASISFSYPYPAYPNTVKVDVQAVPGYSCVWLIVNGPGLDVTLGAPAVSGGNGNPYVWSWDVALNNPGTYSFRFTVNNHSPCSITHESIVCNTHVKN